VPITVAIITASMMLFTFRAMNAEIATMIITRSRFTTSISFIVAVGRRCLWIRSREMQDAPDVAKVSVQDMDAAAKPMVRSASNVGDTLSLMIFRYSISASASPVGLG